MARLPERRARVAAHYDELTPHYVELWGEHIHHGYYSRGDESREEATRKLIDLLVADLELAPGAAVLDVGCGVGGTSRLLARELGCRVIGVTISRVQARMAADRGGTDGAGPRFVVADAAALPLARSFDVVLAIEVLSHVSDPAAFFREAARLLRPGGRLGIAAWLRAESLTVAEERTFIRPIEDGMLVTLPRRSDHERRAVAAGLQLLTYRDVSEQVAHTWDLCLDLVRNPAVWSIALQRGGDTLAFVKSFRAMQRGFASRTLRYALLVLGRA